MVSIWYRRMVEVVVDVEGVTMVEVVEVEVEVVEVVEVEVVEVVEVVKVEVVEGRYGARMPAGSCMPPPPIQPWLDPECSSGSECKLLQFMRHYSVAVRTNGCSFAVLTDS